MNRYLKLLADNRKAGHFKAMYPVQAKEGDEATIYLYDAIVSDELTAEFWGGVSPESFVKTLKEIKTGVIHLRINSPGGDVFAARAIEQALREHPAKVVAHIDGYAASAASFVAMAADEIVMNEGAFFMIHKAWTLALGNSDDMISTADLLEKIDDSLIRTYAKRTGKDPQEIGEWMAAETWISADDAIEHGFADSIDDGAKASAHWNLSAYENAPVIENKEPPKPEPAPEPKPESLAEPKTHKLTEQDRRRLLSRTKIKPTA